MRSIRSLWWSVRTDGSAPFDTAHLKVYYPALASGSDAERLTGVFAPDPAAAPYPVVLFLSGVNVGQESYRRFATTIAESGFVVVTLDRVAELFGGQHGLTPGVDLAAARPDAYGTRPTCPTIGLVLEALAELNTVAPLRGTLDLDRVALGGHSAGGTVVLQSARFFPSVAAVFAWGAHTMVATMLGWDPGTVLPAQVRCPVLLGVGTNDGVIQGSADRYGEDGADRPDPVRRTFFEALPAGDHLLAVVPGANHFGIADADPTAARAFLDGPGDADAFTPFTRLASAFLRTHLRGEAAAKTELAEPGTGVRVIRS
ncbi:alpha/beta hydrolase family protein [Nocardia huaxiensis]|uniref:Dienelactone hydrolase family protein n=1 Tax=Nocardia huaxiensis TaxID=2755382 RepID=A0A7D6V7S5_9NOCA|nr:dienelactone hydrolase family protein [Nocardia huaxiensis]QLY28794.1 dienelactone hydrolase family protein [Nocardia huaxiensis]UFS97730.1 dienelactone hydrolase family protein [Nocardia huaxiensis]